MVESGMMERTVLLLAIASSIQLSAAFYLPGVASKTFRDGDEVNIKVQTVRECTARVEGSIKARACSRLCPMDRLP